MKIKLLRRIDILILFWITGCAPLPEISKEISLWQAHQQVLNELHNWEFTGRIAIQHEDQGWFANIYWRQNGADYQIKISGPAGQGAAYLEGNPNHVTLKRNDQNIYHAARPEELLATHFGWKIPVNGLQYWIRGMPAPNEYNNINWDSAGRIIQLNQDGWNIQFNRYSTVKHSAQNIDLPQHLILKNAALQVKFILENWTLLK